MYYGEFIMNFVSKYLLYSMLALNLFMISSALQANNFESPEFIAAVTNVIKAAEKMKKPVDTISGNFYRSGSGFVSGAYDLGLGASRLVLDGSNYFAQFGKFMRKHYWLLGMSAVGAAYFYRYVLPKISVRISYSNDARPAGR